MFDPDAPTGSGWWQWVVFNIPPTTTSLAKTAGDVTKKVMPKVAIQAFTDLEPPAMAAPVHRRAKRLIIMRSPFAVDVDKLPNARSAAATGAGVGFDLHFHALAKVTLTGLYDR